MKKESENVENEIKMFRKAENQQNFKSRTYLHDCRENWQLQLMIKWKLHSGNNGMSLLQKVCWEITKVGTFRVKYETQNEQWVAISFLNSFAFCGETKCFRVTFKAELFCKKNKKHDQINLFWDECCYTYLNKQISLNVSQFYLQFIKKLSFFCNESTMQIKI